jgi:hypothetical protein
MSVVDTLMVGNRASEGGGVVNSGDMELVRCDIRENEASGLGGGIRAGAFAESTIRECTIARNSASSGGGVNSNVGTVNLFDTTVTQNTVAQSGGGIFSVFGVVSATRCTVSDNDAQRHGGGIFNRRGPATFTNCTLTGNFAEDTGGAVHLTSEGAGNPLPTIVSLTNCTVHSNAADHGGGGILAIDHAEIVLNNTIVSSSTGGDCMVGLNGHVNDAGFNIIEDGSCVSAPTSITGDPLLGPLSDNGGPTLTHALLRGSIAINAGDCAGGTVTTDQRGVTRPQGGACDIGAFEFVPTPPIERSMIPIE